MKYSNDFLEAIRKILNETRQDRVCRPLLARRGSGEVLPFLGSLHPAYCFLGTNPAGYDLSDAPTQADDYIEYATTYFAQPNTDKASFTGYLPYAANHSGDYPAFGEAACVTYLVPILTQRSSEVTAVHARTCWPRTKRLLDALRPNLLLVHGALAWKFLTGQEEETAVLTDVPDSHRQGIPEMYGQLDPDKLPLQCRWEGFEGEYRPWIVPLPHLGGTGAGKELRKKAEQAVQIARRRLSAGGTLVAAPAGGAARIRVRRPG